jgi:broad specificity phosphatase PhoE
LLKVILVRHGQTGWNQERRIQGGNADTKINTEGERQCSCLAAKLQTEKVVAVYSSPMSRALYTAEAVASCHNLTVVTDNDLREINCGSMEGVPISDIGHRLQMLVQGGDENELLFKQCGGESLEELKDRAWGSIQRIAKAYPDGTVVVVSHYFTIAVILCAVLGLPATELGRFRLGETSVSNIMFDEKYGPFLSLFNDRCHLLSV